VGPDVFWAGVKNFVNAEKVHNWLLSFGIASAGFASLAVTAPLEIAAAFWGSIRHNGSLDDFEIYLQGFGYLTIVHA